MDFIFLFKGLLLGFAVSAPVGPIGILCINRTINKNFLAGFLSGLGATTADLIYGIIAGFGITFISDFLIDQKFWIQLVGMIILIFVGIRIILRKESDIELKVSYDKGLLKDYLSTFAMTITNPLTIIFFIAVFAGLGLSNLSSSLFSIFLLLNGVLIGAALWWSFLSWFTHKMKTRINKSLLRRIDLVSGIAILFFAFLILVNLILVMKKIKEI